MKHLACALSIGAVVLTARVAPAMVPGFPDPLPLDHLICYQMKDPLKLQPSADFLAQLQPEFSQKGCTLLKPIEFCVPATKRNVSPAALDPNITGAALSNDYICYKAKCPNPIPPPDKQVIDQFGVRVEENYKVVKVCVPAQKRPLRCSRVSNICQGACPHPTDLCKTVKQAGGLPPACQCVPQTTCSGKPDAAGQCGGVCPPDTTGQPQVCRPGLINPSATSTRQVLSCTCLPPPPPVCGINTENGQCGGACADPTATCVMDAAGNCTCEPVDTTCHTTAIGTCSGTTTACLTSADCPKGATCVAGTTPTCGGDCPTGQNCTIVNGTCGCAGAQCSQDPLKGTCGGPCPDTATGAAQLCTLDSTGHCLCQTARCGSVTGADGTTTCGGQCPTGQECKADATGACNCQDVTTNTCTGTCNPPCLTGQTCDTVPGTTSCACQCAATSCNPAPCPNGTSCKTLGPGQPCECLQ